jgi:hypothetical protein
VLCPADRQVTQRDNTNCGTTSVVGVLAGPADQIDYSAQVAPGGSGQSVAWRTLTGFRLDRSGIFTGRLSLPAGGWYVLRLRPSYQGSPGPAFVVGLIGVGEVFITAGQSNAVNAGTLDPSFRPDDRISSFGISTQTWATPLTPCLPFAQGNGGGNPFVYMADALVREWNVPIGLVSVGQGGTYIRDWQPGAHYWSNIRSDILFDRLTSAIRLLGTRGGFRAVLWHQGESDHATPIRTYENLLRNLILQSRAVTRTRVPWVIALVAYFPPLVQPLRVGQDPLDPKVRSKTVRHAQAIVAWTEPDAYLGPTTDDLDPAYRSAEDYIHLNVLGLEIHGARWAWVLTHTPELIPSPLNQPVP